MSELKKDQLIRLSTTSVGIEVSRMGRLCMSVLVLAWLLGAECGWDAAR